MLCGVLCAHTRPCRQELVGRKRDMHLAAFRFLADETARDLRRIAQEGHAEARLARDREQGIQGKRYTIELLISRIVELVEEVRGRHEGLAAEDYTDDGAFRRLVHEMMEARAMAESLLRLYLEDRSRGIDWRMTRTSLREAHRELIAFRTQEMAGLAGEARRAAAEQLCVLRGYAAERIGETNAAGEDPLICAAADGTAGAEGVALLLAAGAATGGEALVAAALYGQREAAAALLDAGIDVDSRAEKVPGSGAGVCAHSLAWEYRTTLLLRSTRKRPRGHEQPDTMPGARSGRVGGAG
jgi:hypothetical protein